ncbi:topoisomerase II [Citrobacter farmeri]|uniref:topoisomerase II n=1 Tax=Citrobacter farmeri TaxID=67824 RepID=UPI0018A0F3D4|nr:topoisomerase II [Citrobacter farmeri]MBU5647623.1 topoisomerase II [Pluralibacter sp. S54_ASV_43]HAT3753739.1 topoisomerase II [Citrobacter amalonaticus]HAU5705296.1 topoisomerase II [Citrobacter freundii]EHK0945364.1 topoisomerase II [Citrobacter farmeri]EKX4540159.1 topoisomerase II [Citrobacter farmeri]
MNWTHVLLAGYVGAVIAAVIGLMRKKGWVGKASGAVLMIVAIVAWNLFDVHYLIPREKAASGQTEEQQFDAALLQMPTFQVLKEQEPKFWLHLRTQALQLKNEGKTEQQIIDTIQPQVLQIQMSRLQQAPDSNVIDYMKINLEQIAAVQKKGDDECFRFLFPQVKGGINPMRLISQDILKRRMEGDATMMRAAYGVNKHTVTDAEKQQAMQDLQNVVPILVQRYGQDVQLMAEPQKGVGKEKVVCDLVQDMWVEVLKLPAAQAAGVIRLSVSPEMQ